MRREIIEWIICIFIALVLAVIFRYFIATPTIVKHSSMYPTLIENERLILNRTFRITNRMPKRYEIITFEAPSVEKRSKWDISQSDPTAIYNKEPQGIFNKFVYYCLEFKKTSYIKRVIGLPGDHIEIQNGNVYINGNELEENYLKDDVVTEADNFYNFIVPDGYIFAIGDNRAASMDCREFGCIPINKIEGIVLFRFFPFNKIGTLK